jgi:hypothetical protein
MITIKNSLVFLILLFPKLSVYADNWLPITEAELALTECEIDPEFGAEYLFKKYQISGTISNVRESLCEKSTTMYRIKIYDNRGVEQFLDKSVDRKWVKGANCDLKARTVKPDGQS